MKQTEKIKVLENLKYAQHILHGLPQADFNEFISGSHSRFNSHHIGAALLNLLHGLNDLNILEQTDFKKVCIYLNTDPEQSFEELERLLANRATGNHIPLKLSETKRLLQCIIYLVAITDASIPRNRIAGTELHIRGLYEFLYRQGEGLMLA